MRVVIVGGGIAGLTVAYRLRGRAHVTLLEERDRLGGVIRTEHDGGFLIEGGPDSFLTTKPWAAELARELGLGDRIITPQAREVYVVSRGKLERLPDGVFLTVPTRMGPWMKTKLLSTWGKLRAGMDLVLPRGAEADDESIGSFVRRRLGREVAEKLADPIMAGIYMADADRISLRATFPRFADLERDHRSLIRGLRRQKTSGSLSPFASLRGGIGELADALIAALEATVRTRTSVSRVEPGRVVTGDGPIEADAVVLAVPPAAASAMLAPSALADAIARIRSVGSVTVSLGYRGVALPPGTGFVIPRAERRSIIACTWSSQKFAGRAPEGHVLVRCFLGEESADPVAEARDDLQRLLGIAAEPAVSRVFRWPGANPVYEVGHLARVREIESLTPPGLFLTGSGFRGIGLPDGIRDATEIASRVAR